MTDMTSEQYRELADLCGPTAENLRRIAAAYRSGSSEPTSGSDVALALRVAAWLTAHAANEFGRRATHAHLRAHRDTATRLALRWQLEVSA